MKNKILTSAAGLVASATILGVSTALFAVDPTMIARLSSVGGILVVGSMGLFFVGLVYPKGEK